LLLYLDYNGKNDVDPWRLPTILLNWMLSTQHHKDCVQMKWSHVEVVLVLVLDELEFQSKVPVVSMPLVFAVVVAALSQFLVGYNTGVMNAPAKVVFPGHSTLSWSLTVWLVQWEVHLVRLQSQPFVLLFH
jgi:hypothetical protein